MHDGRREQFETQDPAGAHLAALVIEAPDCVGCRHAPNDVPLYGLRRHVKDSAVMERAVQLYVLRVHRDPAGDDVDWAATLIADAHETPRNGLAVAVARLLFQSHA